MKSRPTCTHPKTKVLKAPAFAVALAMILGFNTQAFGQSTSFDIYGHRANEGGGGAISSIWTKGNLGNTWAEGEWVPYKLEITNVQTNFPGFVGLPDLEISFDFTNKGNRFIDLVRGIQVSHNVLVDAQGWPADDGSGLPSATRQDLENAQNDIGNTGDLENVFTGFTLLRTGAPTTFGANIETLVNRDLSGNTGDSLDDRHMIIIPRASLIEAGLDSMSDTIVIYFQVHESRTFLWINNLFPGYDQSPTDNWGGYQYSLPQYANDARPGAGFVPGSSGHLHLENVSGSKDVPIPIPEQLPGAINGLKWLDQNGNGVFDMGSETTLSGWVMTVSGTLEGIGFSASDTTDSAGIYSFPNLTSATPWTIKENDQRNIPSESGYMQTYPIVGTMVGNGDGVSVSSPPANVADVGWLVELTIDEPDQDSMDFGNKLCEISCVAPGDTTISCTENSSTGALGIPVVTFNCGPIDTTFSEQTSGTCPTTISRRWIFTDAIGNADTCDQSITVVDTTAPVITCPADTVFNCTMGNAGIATATDNCDSSPAITFVDDTTSARCPLTISRTWIATDSCGNADSCVQSITVQDIEAPVISCPSDTTFECHIGGNPGTATATDNCDPNPLVTSSDSVVTGSCSGDSTIYRTWIATDTCGNADTCLQVITYVDTTPPVVTCPADTVFNCVMGNPGTATATDNCDSNPTVSFTDDTTSTRCPLSITRTWVAVDCSGNADTCVQSITVQDIEAPVISCPADTVFECVMGNAGVATATDNCDPNPNITSSDDTTSARCPLMITRTWIATDTCGNADTCTQFITVQDTTAPVIVCPADTTFECNVGGNSGVATATDNCDPNPNVTFSDVVTPGSCPQDTVITRTWIAVDTCGNADTCVQTITIQDTTPPVVTCPADTVFECVMGNAGTATATDNCDPNPSVTSTDDTTSARCPLMITRTWVATDCSGNADTCVQFITVQDTTAPVITCPADTVFSCDAGNAGTATATDNCDPNPTITSRDDTTSTVCPLVILRTWYATDSCGNVDSCVQSITVQDTTAPVISCPADTTFECNIGGNPGTATATDNCDSNPGITSSDAVSFGSCDGDSTITRTWIATDFCGNADTCVQIIRYVDTTPPVITCPADTVFECVIGVSGQATATDNCDPNPSITSSDDTTSARCPLMITRTWVATDCSGNADTCVQLIKVQDTLAPVIVCPADTTFECNAGGNSGVATASDNCDPNPSITSSDVVTTGSCPQDTVITRTWIAVDTCGNADTCIQTITIQDTTPPVVTCPADTVFECAMGDAGSATATDNCDPNPTITSTDDTTSARCPLMITRTWVATDCSGNADTCEQLITVQDTLAPVITCPADTVFECSMGNAGTATATDNCDPNPTIASSDDTTSSRCPLIILRTWTATDTCGNVDSCVQTITVQDTTAPVITCAAGDTVECDAAIVFTPPTATDNCDSVVITMLGTDTTAGPGDGQTTYTRSWVATDSCGNSSDTCTQSIVEEPCGEICTFTIGGWGTRCPGSQANDMLSTQPGCIRDHYFALVFPSGVTIGDPAGVGGGNPNFYAATWTTSAAVAAFLPDGGTPKSLTIDATNPTETSAGVLASQVLALTLNREYSCAGVFDSVNIGSGCYGSEIIPESCGKFAGITVDSFLVLANKVVGGKKNGLNGWDASASDVNFTATCLNELHHDCDPFAILTIFGTLDTFDPTGTRSTDSAAKVLGDKVLPTEFSLSQNYPNPFNPASKILFGLPEASHVSLEVYNIMGQRVETLVNDHLEAGYHTVYWNATAYSSGVYFYRIKAGAFSETKKMMLLK